jgi:hypothetical protein
VTDTDLESPTELDVLEREVKEILAHLTAIEDRLPLLHQSLTTWYTQFPIRYWHNLGGALQSLSSTLQLLGEHVLTLTNTPDDSA